MKKLVIVTIVALYACSYVKKTSVAKLCQYFDDVERLYDAHHDPALIWKEPIGSANATLERCLILNEKKLSADTQDSADLIARAIMDSCRIKLLDAEYAWNKIIGPTPAAYESDFEEAVLALVVRRRANHCVGP